MLATEPTPYKSAALAAVVTRIRAVSESHEMAAIQRSLPIGFGGFVVGLGGLMLAAHGTLLARFSSSFGAAFGIMSAVLVVVLAFDLARRREDPVAPAVAISAVAFGLSLPYRSSHSFVEIAKAVGSSGLFLAIGVALATVGTLTVARRRFGPGPGAVMAGALVIGIAAALCALGFSLAAALQVAIAPLANLGDSLTALVIIVAIETLLWAVGIHGPALLAAAITPVYLSLQQQNTEALQHGQPLPHIVTVSMFLFVFPGGAGATLPLVLLLLRSKVRRVRNIAFATLLPSLANTNEPLMFGLPVVWNPVLAVPFVLVPIVLAIVSWEAMNLGLVAKPAFWIPYFVPIPFGAFLATRDWRSIVLVAVNLGLSLAIYAPFVRHYEAAQVEAEAREEAP